MATGRLLQGRGACQVRCYTKSLLCQSCQIKHSNSLCWAQLSSKKHTNSTESIVSSISKYSAKALEVDYSWLVGNQAQSLSKTMIQGIHLICSQIGKEEVSEMIIINWGDLPNNLRVTTISKTNMTYKEGWRRNLLPECVNKDFLRNDASLFLLFHGSVPIVKMNGW